MINDPKEKTRNGLTIILFTGIIVCLLLFIVAGAIFIMAGIFETTKNAVLIISVEVLLVLSVSVILWIMEIKSHEE